MKSLKNIAIVFFAALLMVACGGSKPETTAENFQAAMKSMDFEAAKKYCTKETAAMLDMAKSMMPTDAAQLDSLKKEGAKVQSKFVKTELSEDKNTAVVYFETTDKDGNKKEDKIDMKKVDGEWKVTINK